MSDQQVVRSWTEAPASMNVKATVRGRDVQFTIRGESGAEILNKADGLFKWLDEHAPISNPKPPNAAPAPRVSAPSESKAPAHEAQTFACSSLVATVNDGKTYWKAKGVRFEKYGVTVWGEVLEASGLTNLDPMQKYDLSGWVATYVTKDDGKPDKVTKLSRPS